MSRLRYGLMLLTIGLCEGAGAVVVPEHPGYYAIQLEAQVNRDELPLKKNLRWWIKHPKTDAILYYSKEAKPLIYIYPGHYRLVARYRESRVEEPLLISKDTPPHKTVNFKAGTIKFFTETPDGHPFAHKGARWLIQPAAGSLGNKHHIVKTISQYPSFTLPAGQYDLFIDYGHYHAKKLLHVKEGVHQKQTISIPVGKLTLSGVHDDTILSKHVRWEIYLDSTKQKPVTSSSIANTDFYLPAGHYEIRGRDGVSKCNLTVPIKNGETTNTQLTFPTPEKQRASHTRPFS
jgi:hypothetical protein